MSTGEWKKVMTCQAAMKSMSVILCKSKAGVSIIRKQLREILLGKGYVSKSHEQRSD